MSAATRPRVLVAEPLAESGVELLRERCDVDLGYGWSAEELADRIGAYDALLIRSATQVTADLIARADRLRVIGRAGVGVNNVDVPAATKRGIVVANAPQSNVVSAAEHTVALMLALARNVPQAHASLAAGRWERSRLAGVELYDKTLGILGFGRIGQLVAERAKALGMRVVAYDPFVAAERYREMAVDKAETSADVYAVADFITIHLPVTAQTENWLDAEAFAQMRDGVRVLNVARGELVVDADLQAALESGKVAGAALDVFRTEPITDHPLFGHPRVVATPHLGASTAEAQDRAGVQTAEQVVAALTGGVVSTAVNIPAVGAEDMEALGPFLPLAEQLGAIAVQLADSTVDRVEVDVLGRLAEHDTRLLTIAVLNGLLRGHTEEQVNYVNAPSMVQERGIEVTEMKQTTARDFTDLIRVTVISGTERRRVAGTTLGQRHRPHLIEVWSQRFNLQLEPYLALFRYRDQPGMIGQVGTVLGERGVNVSSAAVGHADGEADGTAVMAVTTDAPVPAEAVQEILAADGFYDGRTVALVH
jgi:D-3-phosphoglycerate dehydrogenase / 2-oxoglutarate reductase